MHGLRLQQLRWLCMNLTMSFEARKRNQITSASTCSETQN